MGEKGCGVSQDRDLIADMLAAAPPVVVFMTDEATDGQMRACADAVAEQLPGVKVHVIAAGPALARRLFGVDVSAGEVVEP